MNINVEDTISQLKDLVNNRKLFFSNDSDDEIFWQDYKGIQLLEKSNGFNNNGA